MRLAEIVQYGGISVMFPAALVVAGWLCVSRSRTATLLWGVLLLATYVLVGVSKILFKGWGIGSESLDIAVISGHAMNVCLIVPVMLSLVAGQIRHSLRWPAAYLGLVLAWWFTINCVTPYLHPLPEAIAGGLIGSLATCVFLYFTGKVEIKSIHPAALVCGFLVIGFCSTVEKYSAETLLGRIAISLSGEEKAFRQPYWRLLSDPS